MYNKFYVSDAMRELISLLQKYANGRKVRYIRLSPEFVNSTGEQLKFHRGIYSV